MKRSTSLWMATRRIRAVGGLSASAFLVMAAGPAEPVSGPIATYWVSASTSSGFMAGAMAGGGRPSLGALMGAFGGGGSAANHSLTLQLSSTTAPTGPPSAEHLPPPGLGVGPTLPLVTPEAPKIVRTQSAPEPREPETFTRPKGKMLIYWGCGEHSPPGQPYVIDFSNIGPGMPIPAMPRMIEVRNERPPSPEGSASYGVWPNEKARTMVPPAGSLVGSHTVRGDYSPPISFDLAPGQDFLPPLMLSSSEKTPAGATRLSWGPVDGATGYFAMMMGGDAGRDGQSVNAVMWSSSAAAPSMGGSLLDYLPPGEVRRLVDQRVVLPPQATECLVPVEVSAAVKAGIVQMIAYGDEVNFADPPRPQDPRTPWKLRTVVKVRFKSTTSAILGMQMPGGPPPGGMTQASNGDAPPPPPPSAASRAQSVLKGLGGLGGFIP